MNFPFGRFDYSAVAAARELGVDIACTSVPEAATVTDDRHTLPRLQALDIDGDAFARRVGGETIAPALDTVDGCWICDGLDEE